MYPLITVVKPIKVKPNIKKRDMAIFCFINYLMRTPSGKNLVASPLFFNISRIMEELIAESSAEVIKKTVSISGFISLLI